MYTISLNEHLQHHPLYYTSVSQYICSFFRFVITHYDDVEPYFAMDPLLRAVFVALTPEAEFLLLCQRMPPFLTASRLTRYIQKAEIVDKKAVYFNL